MNIRNRYINKAALILILTAVFSIFAFATSWNVYAGGGYDMPNLKGVESDDTIKPGSKVYITYADLEAASSGITSDTDVKFFFEIRKTTDLSEEPIIVNAEKSTFAGGSFSLDINKTEYCDRYIKFCSHHPTDTGLNNNGKDYYVQPDQLHLGAGPEILGVQYKGSLVSKDIVVTVSNTAARYKSDTNPEWRYEKNRTIKLYCNGTLVGTQTNSSYSTTFAGVPVKYGEDTSIKVEVWLTLEGLTIGPISKTYTIPGGTLETPTAYATKINNKQVALTWTTVQGATGYEIYKGNKKIKTAGAVSKYTVKGKGVGKAKYKVVPILSQGSQTYKGGASGSVKPQKNEVKLKRGTHYSTTSYATCPFRITKISLKGNTYTVTGYAVNNRIFKMKKYKNFRVGLYVGGKKAFLKKYKSKAVNCKSSGSKKIVLKIKGKKGVDLRNGGYLSYIEGGTPVW